MRELYPAVFDRGQPKPLAIGTNSAISDALGELDRRVLGSFMRYWTTRWPYLKALAAEGSMRHALDGSVVEPVSEEHRQIAAEQRRTLKGRDHLDRAEPKSKPKPNPKAPKAPEPTKARVEPKAPPLSRRNGALPTLRLSRVGS